MKGAARVCGMGFVAMMFVLTGGVLAQGGGSIASAHGNDEPVLLLSDIHFDPFRDPGKVIRLAESSVEGWEAILHEPASADAASQYAAMQTACKARGLDTDSALLDESLKASQAKAEGVRFVTVTGDLLVHKFGCRYKTVMATRPALNTSEGYESFAAKTANYVMRKLGASFPKASVYVSLGNNDSGCGDYQMDENDRFLTDTATAVARGWRGAGDQELSESIAQYRVGGYYGVSLSGRSAGRLKRTRLLVLNDVFLSPEYAGCGKSAEGSAASAAAAEKEMTWLENELTTATRKGEQVWVMGHIPPGIDAYATLHDGRDVCSAGGKEPEGFLASESLGAVLEKHADVIRLAIFGHAHTDELRLVGKVPLKVVPSISPINGNVAGFTVADVNASTATLDDYTVYDLAGTQAAPEWKKEYRFSELYGKTGVTAANLQDLIGGFRADPGVSKPQSQAYVADYAAGIKVPLLALVWPKYTCMMGNSTAATYKNCVCTKTP